MTGLLCMTATAAVEQRKGSLVLSHFGSAWAREGRQGNQAATNMEGTKVPTRAPRICPCGHRIAAGNACPCERAQANQRKARHDETRPSARARGYNSDWQRARRRWLRAFPYCAKCGAPANVVDHIVPHKGDPKLFWNESNWQSLCSSCHNSGKQSEERRGEGSRLSNTSGDRRAGSRAKSIQINDASGVID